jgi:hypothetical protein
MIEQPDLFADLGYTPPIAPLASEPEVAGHLGSDARRTLRRRQALANGMHPATKSPLREPVGEVHCRDCLHKITVGGGSRTYVKCVQVGLSRSAASDIRASWPACVHFQPITPETPQ